MIPTDTETTNFTDESADQKMISPTFASMQVDSAASGFEATASESHSPTKQYIIVAFVLAVSAVLLWYMRDQGLGVGLASGDEIKIEYELDESASATDTQRQRQLLFDLELTDNPMQIPVGDLKKNPFAMAVLTAADEPEPVSQGEQIEVATGPTAEEIRAQELETMAEDFELNTVLRGRVSLARIDGKTYRIGDVVESEFILLTIDDRSVTLGADGKTYFLEIDSD